MRDAVGQESILPVSLLCAYLSQVFIDTVFISSEVAFGGEGVKLVALSVGLLANQHYGGATNHCALSSFKDVVECIFVIKGLQFFYLGDIDDIVLHDQGYD